MSGRELFSFYYDCIFSSRYSIIHLIFSDSSKKALHTYRAFLNLSVAFSILQKHPQLHLYPLLQDLLQQKGIQDIPRLEKVQGFLF